MLVRPIGARVLACLVLLSTVLPVSAAADVRAAAGPDAVVVAEFGSSEWVVASGSASATAVSSPTTSGAEALRISYDVGAGGVAVATRTTAPLIPGAPRSIQVDVYGDVSWNVFYVELRDATGEIFRYWAGSLGFSGWQTLSFPVGTPSDTLVARSGGDGDAVLDLPVSLHQVVVYPGPARQKTVSTVWVDHLVATTDPSRLLQVSPDVFSPTTGETAGVAVQTVDGGPFTVTLADSGGFSWSWGASAPGGSSVASTTWNGRTPGGALLSGSVSGRLSLARGGLSYTYDVPYAAGIALRAAVSPPQLAGVNTFMTAKDTVARASVERLALLAETAHVQVVREAFDWHRVEPRQGYFDWPKFDQAVEVARAHRLEVLGRLQYSAGWASSAPASVTGSARYYYPPADVATFAAYARAVVHRYKDRIHRWEIWNEPNEKALWGGAPNAAGYAALLKAAYAAIKAEDPSAVVLLGGLSTGPDQTFLQGVYNAGAWGSFDVLAIHAFVNDDPASSTSMFPVWIDLAKSTVAAKGSKPIWITEWGWSTYTKGVSEASQADYVANGFAVAASKGVAGIVLYELEDYGTNSGALIDNYGTITRGGRYKPSYQALDCSATAISSGRIPACGSGAPPPGVGVATTYVPVAPTRLLDSRVGNGLSGRFTANTARTFQVAGRGPVPANAVAVTGNLTVTKQTAGGFAALTPVATNSPTTSTLNFPPGDNRANNVTVALGGGGKLAAVYKAGSGQSTDLVFDVTGYFVADTSGATYEPVAPVRLLDTRVANGLGGTFAANVPRTWDIAGRGGIPAGATAITGNLTVVGETAGGYVSVGPDATANPTTSTLNFPPGDIRANGLTVKLGAGGRLSAVYKASAGATTHLVLDVTGYYLGGLGGARFYPLSPGRALDTRYGIGFSGAFAVDAPRSLAVAGRVGVPAGALAISGNVTVVGQTKGGYVSMTQTPTSSPTTSTVNFPVGDVRANGVTGPLDGSGAVGLVYKAGGASTTHLVVDVTGYFGR